MEINMATLGVGVLTAYLFGLLLWGGRFAVMSLATLLCGGTLFSTRKGRVLREIGVVFYMLFTACAVTVFLYYVNHGIFRWFFCMATVVSFWIAVKCVEKRFFPHVERITQRIRCGIGSVCLKIARPLIWLLKKLVLTAKSVILKMSLPIRRKYGKISVSIYDKKRRRNIYRSTSRELDEILRGQEKHGH